MAPRGIGAKKVQRSKPMKKVAAFMAAMMSLSLGAGCRVGPNYHRPVVQPPTAFRDLSENAQQHAAQPKNSKGSKDRHRRAQQDAERQRPAFVECRQNQKDE